MYFSILTSEKVARYLNARHAVPRTVGREGHRHQIQTDCGEVQAPNLDTGELLKHSCP